MAVHARAHQGARPGPGRKAIKLLKERLRREQRDLAREMQERAGQGFYPARDQGGSPKID